MGLSHEILITFSTIVFAIKEKIVHGPIFVIPKRGIFSTHSSRKGKIADHPVNHSIGIRRLCCHLSQSSKPSQRLTGLIFLDLSKAFDTLDSSIMLD